MGLSSEEKSTDRRSRHVSAKDKSKAVMRVLKGETGDAVAQDVGVSVSRLQRWESTFVTGGLNALEKQAQAPKHTTLYQKLQKNSKFLSQWIGLLVALVLTILLLIRFLSAE